MRLDKNQQRAATDPSPRVICVASAGSGKTRTLVEAVGNAIDAVGAGGVAVVTFTNAGAAEFTDRLAARGWKRPGFCGTIHSLCFMLARRRWACSAIMEDEREERLEQVLNELKLEGKVARSAVDDALDPWKNAAADPSRLTKAQLVARSYYKGLWRDSCVDFDTMVYYGLAEARKCRDFKAVFVDEAQDCSPRDWEVVEALEPAKLFAVGDPDQAIYGFRGGSVAQMVARALSLSWKCHYLDTNYRSGEAIVRAAERVVERNTVRVTKPPTVPLLGGEVLVHAFEDERAETAWHVRQILERPEGETVAVLARTNALAAKFREALRSVGVDCCGDGGRKAEKATATQCALAALFEPWNDRAVARALARGGYTDSELETLRSDAEKRACSLAEVVDMPTAPPKCAQEVWDGLVEYGVPADVARELSDMAAAGLDQMALVESCAEPEKKQAEGQVHVGTVHSAKGLEFDEVRLVGVEEGTWPPAAAKEPDGFPGVEEERRLFYVAATRAKQRLVVTWSEWRSVYRGKDLPPGPAAPRQASRFVQEMKG